jgi:16S rRNA (guanine966-N2)-methyltransferase
VREALFSAVEAAMDIDGVRVLDLYAGSGALGLEALSRGAAHATFVESDRGAISVLEKNIAAVGLPGAEVRRGKVATVLATDPSQYDLILADPPYELNVDDVIVALAQGWTMPGSVIVVERARKSGEPGWPEPLVPMRVRRYGDTELHWARHSVPDG